MTFIIFYIEARVNIIFALALDGAGPTCKYLNEMVGRGGFEPPTNGLKVELYTVSV